MFIVLSGQNILFVEVIFSFIFQNKEGRGRGCVRCVLRRVLGVHALCRVCVRGVVGRVRDVCGVWGGVWCVCVGACVAWGRGRKYRSPLYYPDTLVNLDTCLGRFLPTVKVFI